MYVAVRDVIDSIGLVLLKAGNFVGTFLDLADLQDADNGDGVTYFSLKVEKETPSPFTPPADRWRAA
jgi:hypothetical protein